MDSHVVIGILGGVFRSLVPPLVKYRGKCPPNLEGGTKDNCRTTAAKFRMLEDKCSPNSLYKCPPTTAATAKIVLQTLSKTEDKSFRSF